MSRNTDARDTAVVSVTKIVGGTTFNVIPDNEEGAVETPPPTVGGEDFSAYQRAAPAAFFYLGVRNEAKGTTCPNHHPRFEIDEDALEIGVKMFVRAAFGLLEAKAGNGTRG